MQASSGSENQPYTIISKDMHLAAQTVTCYPTGVTLGWGGRAGRAPPKKKRRGKKALARRHHVFAC